ncbi:aldose epimerase family protein [Romboutsia lituseburensis]|uniref:aldose epimerase family protein n=1 Tax=Romboutsia lituseburensis TaxID=1537 RepID=UPI00215ACEBD|nr:galactose mutarotase [Romboutsia lituseburensis]MCR8744437.1 galactose mutarotase [Romboutsia lituseburensis]
MKCTKSIVGKINDKNIVAYNIKYDNKFEVEILNLGGIITKIITPDKYNNFENVVVGYKEIESYIENPSYLGAIIGRTSGRICEGNVTIDDRQYSLSKNYNPHHGHGGNVGFNKKIWEVNVIEDKDNITLRLSTISKDKEENYPGNLDITLIFKIYEDFTIEQIYECKCDKTTLVNLTNHSYFNLSGNIKAPITTQYLKIDSDYILELDETCAVTGKSINVKDTAFDFNNMKCIGEDIDCNNDQIKIGSGYDHTFLLNKNGKIHLEDRASKRVLDISTDQKSVVVYSMNFPDEFKLYNGKKAQRRFGICFETQAPPIGRNMCFIKDSILNKGEVYKQKTVYKFSIK